MPAKFTWKGKELNPVSSSLRPMTWAHIRLGRQFRCLLSPCSLTSKFVNIITCHLLVPSNNLYKKNSWLSWLNSVGEDTFLFHYLHWDSSGNINAQWGQVWWLQDLGEHGVHPGGEWGENTAKAGEGTGKVLGWTPPHWIWLSHAGKGRASPSTRIPGVLLSDGRPLDALCTA